MDCPPPRASPSTCHGEALFPTEIQSLGDVYVVVQAVGYGLSAWPPGERLRLKRCLLCMCRRSHSCRCDDLDSQASCCLVLFPWACDHLLKGRLWKDDFSVNVFSLHAKPLRLSHLVCVHAMALNETPEGHYPQLLFGAYSPPSDSETGADR